MGKIYTSYWGGRAKWPVNSLPIGVTRFPPTWSKDVNIAGLAPSAALLQKWHNQDIDWYLFKQQYVRELEDRGLTPKGVRAIFDELAQNRDVVLVCYEKPEEYCHRHILAEWLGGDIEEL